MKKSDFFLLSTFFYDIYTATHNIKWVKITHIC